MTEAELFPVAGGLHTSRIGESSNVQNAASSGIIPAATLPRGRSMSRRRGQLGSISKNGNWWTVRFWKDVPGQEQRVYMREKICPTRGPGLLTASARKLRAKELVAASGADKPETLQASLASVCGLTFRQQSETWLRAVQKRDVAPSTLADWEGCLNTWLLPTIGDLPLAAIKRTVTQELIDKMVTGKLSPKTISNYFAVVKMVFASCVDEDGMETHPRNWQRMSLVIPQVNRRKQHRPCFTKEVMNHLANSLTVKRKMRMLFILCGATGLRFGEALGIRIDKVLDGGSRIVIDQKAWRGEIHDYLKTVNGEREVDLPANVAKLLVEFIGERKTGLLFCTRHGDQLLAEQQSSITSV